MEPFTVGALKRIVRGLDDDVEINLLIDITKIDGRHVKRKAKVEHVETVIGKGTLFDWVDVNLSADLAPDNPLWGMVEDGQITEEDYWEMVAR